MVINPLTTGSDSHVTSPHNIDTLSNQKGNENTQTYQVEVVVLICHQILVTNLQRNMYQLEGRINHQISEV